MIADIRKYFSKGNLEKFLAWFGECVVWWVMALEVGPPHPHSSLVSLSSCRGPDNPNVFDNGSSLKMAELPAESPDICAMEKLIKKLLLQVFCAASWVNQFLD